MTRDAVDVDPVAALTPAIFDEARRRVAPVIHRTPAAAIYGAVRTLDEAAEALLRRRYSVVVTDLRLTGADSEEGLDILRLARDSGGETEVIVVTGYGSPSSMTKAYQLGAAYYFEKPVRPARLLEAVEALCRT